MDLIKRILIYPNLPGRITEDEIASVEGKLAELGFEVCRYSSGIPDGADAVIALGGDGTMLRAAHLAMYRDLPLLGINFGTLGYMSGLESGELDMLSALRTGPKIENRTLIDVCVRRKGESVVEYTALNEAVILRDPGSGIAVLELMCDGAKVCVYRADGVIIATPTGSSAYAMSAGGPIIDTKLDAFCVCPICPHSLGSRALVFSPNSSISVINNGVSGDNVLTADGHMLARLVEGDEVTVVRSPRVLRLIKLKEDAFYDTLYRKMS